MIGLLQSGEGEFPARDMQILFREGYVEIWATFIEIAPTELPAYVRATVEARDGQLVRDAWVAGGSNEQLRGLVAL